MDLLCPKCGQNEKSYIGAGIEFLTANYILINFKCFCDTMFTTIFSSYDNYDGYSMEDIVANYERRLVPTSFRYPKLDGKIRSPISHILSVFPDFKDTQPLPLKEIVVCQESHFYKFRLEFSFRAKHVYLIIQQKYITTDEWEILTQDLPGIKIYIDTHWKFSNIIEMIADRQRSPSHKAILLPTVNEAVNHLKEIVVATLEKDIESNQEKIKQNQDILAHYRLPKNKSFIQEIHSI